MRSEARARIRPWLICGIGVVAFAVCGGLAAQACLFSNVASASANGVLARRVTSAPPASSPHLLALWAPFVFRQTFAPGQLLHLREDMQEVARSLGAQALHWSVHWYFGDGTRATGTSVTHRYRHRGLYRIDVQSDFVGPSGLKGWTDFDLLDVVVGAAPREATWLRRAPASQATPTPTPPATGS